MVVQEVEVVDKFHNLVVQETHQVHLQVKEIMVVHHQVLQ
jgi:hypothetical protein